jgi:hypothetical protein
MTEPEATTRETRIPSRARKRLRTELSRSKAKEMLRHGTAHGKALTSKQKGLFGLIAGGGTPSRR